MPAMYVDIEKVNFRSEPNSNADNTLGLLYLTQRVQVRGELTGHWVKGKARIDGVLTDGFVARRFLRLPVTENREALIASVSREYMRFEQGTGKEHVDPFYKYIGEMWKALGNRRLDGRDRDVPWSAAGVSFMVRNAGKCYEKFAFSASHSKYVHQAIKARESGDESAPFWGYRLGEMCPDIGDIVARDNGAFSPVVTYDVAARLDSYRSHTDIVVSIDQQNERLLAIGGNVSDSVNVSIYDLTPKGFLAGTKHTFAILHNRTDE